MQKKTVLFIISLGHSGSTLIGNIIGNHSNCLHVGEIVAPLKKGRSIICRTCLNNTCPIWGKLLNREIVQKTYQDYTNKKKWSFLYSFRNPTLEGKIYQSIFAKNEKLKVIIDGSKRIEWCNYHEKNNNFKYKYLFLYRNINGVFAALKRSYKVSVYKQLPIIMERVNKLTQFYDSINKNNKILIEYDDLIIDTEQILKRVFQFLEIEYSNNILSYQSQDYHLIGGSNSYLMQQYPEEVNNIAKTLGYNISQDNIDYYKNVKGLKLDERWRKELTQNEQKIINDFINNNRIYGVK